MRALAERQGQGLDDVRTPSKRQRKKQKPLAKLAIGGSITVMFEAFAFGHYMEFLKISKQCAKPGTTYNQITRQMIAHKGLSGILDGFLPWGALMSLLKGASFAWGHSLATNWLTYAGDTMSEQQSDILAGGIGGLFQGVIMNPALLLKTRVMTDPRFRSIAAPSAKLTTSGGTANIAPRAQPSALTQLWQTARLSSTLGFNLVKTEGGLVLMKGVHVFAFKRFCDWTTRFAFVVGLEQLQKQRMGLSSDAKLPLELRLVCGLGGGILSACATLPIDVTVARIQDAKKAGAEVRLGDIYREAMRNGGWRVATAGFVPRASHVALTTLLMKNLTNVAYDAIYKKKR